LQADLIHVNEGTSGDRRDDYILSAGLFDDPARFHVAGRIFISEKPGYHALARDAPGMTGAQVFAQRTGD
jgi:hypothetical protein